MTFYQLRKDTLSKQIIGNYITYGIDVYNDLSDSPFRSIIDISLIKEPLEALINLCNTLSLDDIQLENVIEDFFS